MKRNLSFLIFCLFLATKVFGQASSFRNFSVNEGVAQSQVYSLLQDHQGNIWMGTRGGGISKFDGKKFTTLSGRDGLVNGFVHKMKRGKDNRIWVATNNGVSVYDGRKFESYKLPNAQGNLVVFDMCFLEKDIVWLGTSKGIYAIENEKLVEKNKELNFEPQNVSAVFKDKKGVIWIGTNKGVHRLTRKSSSWKREFMGDQNKLMLNAITCFQEDKKGRLYFGTYGDGMYCFNGKLTYRLDLNKELYKSSVFDIYFDQEGVLWIATLREGIIQYNPLTKAFTSYNQYQGLSNNHVRSILQDNAGNMWFGTSGGGTCQFNGSEFSHFTTTSGLGANFVYSIYRDSQDRLWIGTGQNGLSLFSENKFEQFNSSNGFKNVKVKSIVEDKLGNLYFGTEGQGVFRYRKGEFELVNGTDKLYIRQLKLHPDGSIWMATSGAGLLQIDPLQNKIVQQYNYSNERLLQSRLTCLHIDHFGRIWYGSESYGFGIIDPKTKKKWRFTTKEGLPSGSILSITSNGSGRVFVGTAGAGIIEISDVLEPKILRNIDLEDGLYSLNVYLMVCDDNGNLIVGTESGLDEIQMNNRGVIKKVKHFGKSDGFYGVETCQNSVYKDSDGKMWFGTINGLTCYNPAKASENKTPPLISLADVQLFYESLTTTKYSDFIANWGDVSSINLPYDQNHLSFLFNGINLRNPDGVDFSWRMEGMEEDWSPWSKEQRIVYSNLNSGVYTFLLRAKNEDGFITPKALRVSIEIETPFWRKTWFIMAMSALFLLAIFLLFKWQTNRINRKAKQAQEQAELEKNLVELEQKALRLQMNPHFIFNALNSIQGLIGTQNETEARYYLAKFSRLMRQILDNSRKSTITLEEEIATLENYLLIEQFCNGNRFDYEIKMDLETEPNYIELPPMMIQPYVENSIKHGFKFQDDKTKRGKLDIYFKETEKGVSCIIEDNGIGREKARELTEQSMEGYHVSTGLNVTQERLDLLSEDKANYSVNIEDLKTDEGQAKGTRVKISIPFL
jgi:ligand-binding sensor domain-containing protein/two-component sensor histidine kinase